MSEIQAIAARIIVDVAAGNIDIPHAVTSVTKLVLSIQQTEIESLLSLIWTTVIKEAASSGTTHSNLIEFLVTLSGHTAARVDSDSPIMIYDGRVWHDLPMLGWEVNGVWNSTVISSNGPTREHEISSFVNKVQFVALLIGTSQGVFQPFKMQALWTFRSGLETPIDGDDPQHGELDTWIPAVAAMVDLAGSQLGEATDEYAPDRPGAGRPGKGGPLWEGRDGFSKERWEFWQNRLQDIASDGSIDHTLREKAADTSRKMKL